MHQDNLLTNRRRRKGTNEQSQNDHIKNTSKITSGEENWEKSRTNLNKLERKSNFLRCHLTWLFINEEGVKYIGEN